MPAPKPSFAPDALLLVLAVLVCAIGLTWILPAGEFERTKVGARTVVVPGTYRAVEAKPVPWHGLLTAPVKGFTDPDAGLVIAFVFVVGGAFAVVNATGAVTAALQGLVRLAGNHPSRRRLVIPLLMGAFSVAGNTFGMSEEVLVFVLITLPLARRLGWDPIVGVAIPFVGAGVGFSGAAFNPFTVGIAQGLSELPVFSGWPFRMLLWAALTAIAIVFVMRYAASLEADPSRSLVAGRPWPAAAGAEVADEPLTGRHVPVLAALLGGMVLLVVGVTRWDWYIAEIAGLLFGVGLFAGLFGGLGADRSAQAFTTGARDMVAVALIIGMSKSILLVLQEGRIIDTVLHGATMLIGDLPAALSVQVMLAVQFGLNFFVPSGSGQAALTMPVMTPLADLLQIPRQAAVLAFQLGDGLCNFVIPTSGITMGVLAVGGIPFGTWLRWIGWLMVWLIGTSAVFLALGATVVGW